jgi:hypothetical protein
MCGREPDEGESAVQVQLSGDVGAMSFYCAVANE